MLCLWIAKGLKTSCNLGWGLSKKTQVAHPKLQDQEEFNGPKWLENPIYPIPTVKIPNAHWLTKDNPAIELAAYLFFLNYLVYHPKPLLESKD